MATKVIRAEIAVECDEGVTPDMIAVMLRNQMYFAFEETQAGIIHWQKMRVRFIAPE